MVAFRRNHAGKKYDACAFACLADGVRLSASVARLGIVEQQE